MAVCADKVPVAKMLDAKVPAFLAGMLSGDNDAVFGEILSFCFSLA